MLRVARLCGKRLPRTASSQVWLSLILSAMLISWQILIFPCGGVLRR